MSPRWGAGRYSTPPLLEGVTMARLVTTHFFASVDGVVESPNLWQFDSFDDQLGEVKESGARPPGGGPPGTQTVPEWAGFGATMPPDDPFARFINEMPKY